MVRFHLYLWGDSMKIYIRALDEHLNPKTAPLTLLVKQLGNEIYKYMYGRDKRKSSSDMFDIWSTMVFGLKEEFGGYPNDLEKMTVNINITTYSNKIRVNTIEVSPEEKTLGCDIYVPAKFDSVRSMFNKIFQNISKHIKDEYRDYDILF